MKKFLCLILIAALLIPVAAFADDSIVGTWYMLYDKNKVPEMASNFQNCDLVIATYSFLPDGSVYLAEHDVTDNNSVPLSAVAGKWEAAAFDYSYSVIGLGSGKAIVDKDEIFLEINSASHLYLKLRRMLPYDPYSDYVLK